MKAPRIPPFVIDIVHTALLSFDGMVFTNRWRCPSCGGDLQGYDTKKKKLATIRINTGIRVITVEVRRFRCRSCREMCYAAEPFYPGTRIGSPIVDLFQALSGVMPRSQAARVISAMGIIVNRTTWKNYASWEPGTVPVVDLFGVRLPRSIVAISDMAARAGNSAQPNPDEVIAACGYPSFSHEGAAGPNS